MGVKIRNDSETLAKTKYKFNRKAGKSIIDRRPIFSPDGESVLLIVENIVRVYNILTSDCVRILETEQQVAELIAIEFPDDSEKYNLYGCSIEGQVTTWTWENGAVLRETNLHLPSDHMKVVTFNLVNIDTCCITAVSPSNQEMFVGLFSVKTGQLIYDYHYTKPLYFENMIRAEIGWCQGDRFLAITNGTKDLYCQNLNKVHVRSCIFNTNHMRIISVASHHSESALAITDTLGRVTVLRGNFFMTKSIAREILHWHHLPATAVCFSMFGSYLYTGGIERVLVKWTFSNLAQKSRDLMFIPRLPGIIRYINVNNTHVAVSLSNNSVVIASSGQMRVVQTILECGGLSPAARALSTPLSYHQQLGGLLMGGRTGHLQLYSSVTDKVLYNIDITGMNRIPPQRHNLIPVEAEVTCAAVSGNGTWLVTSEYRNDGVMYPEERLKFWALEIKSSTPFRLNTCVNLSHGGCNVISIAIDQKGKFCVTSGGDQKFRIWKKEKAQDNNAYSQKMSWICLTACYYSSGLSQYLSHGILNNMKISELPPKKGETLPFMKEFTYNDIIKKLVNIHKEHNLFDKDVISVGMKKDDENDMGGVAISQDGSLIAAWFGCKLTLWDTYLCNLKTSLSHPALRPKGIDVKFGSHDAAHYLVCTTENCLAVWSLLSLTVKWLVPMRSTCLAADSLSNKMAVVTTNNDVYVFTPHSSNPILTEKNLLDPDTGVFKQCTFGSNSADEIRLYVVRNDSELYCLEPEKSDQGGLEVISRRNLPTSNFGALLAEQQLSEVQPAKAGEVQQLDTDALTSTAVAQFLSAAPHMVPPVSLLCTSFLRHISGQKETEPTEESLEDPVEVVDSSSEDEAEEKEERTVPKPTQLWTPNYEKVKEKRLQKIVNELLLDLHETEAIFE